MAARSVMIWIAVWSMILFEAGVIVKVPIMVVVRNIDVTRNNLLIISQEMRVMQEGYLEIFEGTLLTFFP